LWKLSDIAGYASAPSAYRPVNRKTASGYVYGARLRRSPGHADASWIRGRQLAFLIDIPSETDRANLVIELAFAPWMRTQSFTVRINDGAPWASGPLGADARDGAFRTWSIPVPMADRRPGPDFVSIVFEQLYADPDTANGWVAARVRDVAALAAE
jgi:hypothetical protein